MKLEVKLLVFFVINSNSFTLVTELASHSSGDSIFMLEAPEYCPTEFKSWTAFADEESMMGKSYKVGDYVKVKCKPLDPSQETQFDLNRKLYFMYPNSTIQCQNDGTWSGPPPICVSQNIKLSNFTVQRNNFHSCPSESSDLSYNCPPDSSWNAVNCTKNECQPNPSSNITTFSQHLLIKLPQNYYLGFVIVSLPFKIHGVQVYVEKSAVLMQDASKFPEEYFNDWAIRNKEITKSTTYCPVVLAAYTDKLIMKIITVDQNLNLPSIYFGILIFPILEGSLTNHAQEQITQSCPPPPTIPNARNFSDSSQPNAQFYICDKGYVMYDPKNKSLADGKLTCVDGIWSPYPFPVCRRIREASSINSNGTNGENCTCGKIGGFAVFGIVCPVAIVSVFIMIFVYKIYNYVTDVKKRQNNPQGNQDSNDKLIPTQHNTPPNNRIT